MPHRECNLECVQDTEEDEVVEFVGPVKIILVNQKKQTYRWKVCYAAFIVLAQMTMASSSLIVLFYSLSYKKKAYMKALHIFMCTIGFQLLLPTGVLTMNSLNGAAAPMTVTDRKFEHGVVQLFGLLIIIAGSVVSFSAKYDKFVTMHSVFGIAANCTAILSAMVGIFLYIFFNISSKEGIGNLKHKLVNIHQVLGALTITLSSVCFLLGIMKDSFNEWLPIEEMFYYLVICCIYYTCVIIYKPLQFTIAY